MSQGSWSGGWDVTQANTEGFFGVRPHDVPDEAYSDDPMDTPNANWVVDGMPRIWDADTDGPPLATGASAGKPGTWTPATSRPPATDEVMAAGVTASPATAWTSGQYVVCSDGRNVWWSGSAWAAGTAP